MLSRTKFDRWACPTQKAVDLIGDKWTLFVIREFIFGKQIMRFNELRRLLKPISSRTLSLKLQKLLDCKILERKIRKETPLRVDYIITPKGIALKDSMLALAKWHRTQVSDK